MTTATVIRVRAVVVTAVIVLVVTPDMTDAAASTELAVVAVLKFAVVLAWSSYLGMGMMGIDVDFRLSARGASCWSFKPTPVLQHEPRKDPSHGWGNYAW